MALAAIGAVVLAALVLGGYLMFRPSAGNGSSPEGIGAGNPFPTPSANVVTPTPATVASPTPPPTVPLPTVSPTVPPSPSPPDDNTAQILVEDIATLGTLADALGKQRFHYTVDDDGTVYARARWKEEDPLNIGVLRLALFGNLAKRREARQTAALVALLTTLAHDNDLDLDRVDFKKGDAVSKMDVIDPAKKLLEGWRATGVKPAEAQVHIVAPASEPPR